MLQVGLTGGIGAGKSTVSTVLSALGAMVVDADQLARRAVEPGTPGLGEIVEAFGPGILAADGTLDRAALARVAFADESSRQRLNAILHPRIADLTLRAIAAAPADAVVVHDVPLLVEAGLVANYQLVVVVTAPESERVRRLAADRDMAEADARARMSAQADDETRAAAADVVLDNSGDRGALLDAVRQVWHERLVPFETNLRLRRCVEAPPAPDDGARGRVAARLRDALGAYGKVEDGDTLRVHVPTDIPDAQLLGSLERAGLVLRSDGTVCSADPGAGVTVQLHRD